MLGVAASALVISLAAQHEAARRASHYRILAFQHAESERISHELLRELEGALLRPNYPRTKLDARFLAQYRREATYYAGLRAKYEEATRHPLFPVAPDPPPPERVSQLEIDEQLKADLRKQGHGDERSE
jgi:hypothetical protein